LTYLTPQETTQARAQAQSLPDLRPHFSHALGAQPDRLHLASHSHHPWPDVSREAHARAWEDAAQHLDSKWDVILQDVLPRARAGIARALGLSAPDRIGLAPNTHQLLVRLFSCLERPGPVRLLTTDSEFHSATRQLQRWEEAGLARVERVPAEPHASFEQRLGDAIAAGGHDLVLFSHVHFNSGLVVGDLAGLVAAVPDPDTLVVIDGYHAFMALPTDLAPIEDRSFYLSGGYKYAMSGEGACFMHCPEGYAPRPVNTGWFARFGELAEPPSPGSVGYARDGWRMAGATFEPTPYYRLAAVLDWLEEVGLDTKAIHAHVGALQRYLLASLAENHQLGLSLEELVPGVDAPDRGHFLTFQSARAAELQAALMQRGVITDHRADRLRLGLGIYHVAADVDELLRRLEGL